MSRIVFKRVPTNATARVFRPVRFATARVTVLMDPTKKNATTVTDLVTSGN